MEHDKFLDMSMTLNAAGLASVSTLLRVIQWDV